MLNRKRRNVQFKDVEGKPTNEETHPITQGVGSNPFCDTFVPEQDTKLQLLCSTQGSCEGRDGSCDRFSCHICCAGCIIPRELRWFKAQWPGVIMSEALWEALWCENRLMKTGYYYYYLDGPQFERLCLLRFGWCSWGQSWFLWLV